MPPRVIDEAPAVAPRPAASGPGHFHANVVRWNFRKPRSVAVSLLVTPSSTARLSLHLAARQGTIQRPAPPAGSGASSRSRPEFVAGGYLTVRYHAGMVGSVLIVIFIGCGIRVAQCPACAGELGTVEGVAAMDIDVLADER
jgi:hypothetical protein